MPNTRFKGQSVFELQKNESFLTTGCPKLDVFLRGGLPKKGITQLYGEAGIGKTQLALQLCLAAQIPTKESRDIGGAAYICTEAAFPSNRLHELLNKSSIAKQHPISMEMIFIEHISNTEELQDCIMNVNKLQQLIIRYKIKLLVIDSIAATYRVEYETASLKNRAKSLRKIGYQLHNLASTYGMTVICINQVTALVGSSSIEHSSIIEQPSLGITWASMVTNSLYMYKKYNHRYLHVAASSYLPNKTIEYEIHDYGIQAKENYL